jgi:Ca-activated chloride channel family protein
MENILGEKRRMDVAKSLLSKMVDSLSTKEEVDMAFRAYGHRSPTAKQDCKDTRLEVGFEPDNESKIIETIAKLKPRGTTPIAYSLSQTLNDFPDKKANNIIILITDGAEECKGNPCAVSQELQDNGIILKPFIIGIGLTEEVLKTYQCVGTYYNSNTEKDFKDVLKKVIAQALDQTTAQLNLNDESGKPTQTNVNFRITDSKSNIAFNLIHTLSSNGAPDTFKLNPRGDCNLIVFTTPIIQKQNIKINTGKHNVINIDAPQGYINVKMTPFENKTALNALVKSKDGKIVFVQDINSIHKYLVGNYDVEILSTPSYQVSSSMIRLT